MSNSKVNISNVSEKLQKNYCGYCMKQTKSANYDTQSDMPSELCERKPDQYDIDHRIVLFGWRLRLASGEYMRSIMVL